MRFNSIKPFLILLTIPVFGLSMGADGCDPDDPDPGVCIVEGRTYANGDTGVPVACNTCSCVDGALTGCTRLACPDDGSCRVGGTVYANGVSGIPAEDGCNTCSCSDGLLGCTEIACPPTGGACIVDGVSYPDGSTGVPAPDGCNSCACDDGLVTGCTEIACPPTGASCSVYGVDYSDGWAPAMDSCNTCECTEGRVTNGCSEAACATPAIERCDSFSRFESHPFDLNGLRVDGDTLSADVAYSGGCAPHYFRLCYEDEWLESFPVQVTLRLEHDSQRDECEAYPSETRQFDLTNLKNAYHDGYGTGPGSILLRLGDGARYDF